MPKRPAPTAAAETIGGEAVRPGRATDERHGGDDVGDGEGTDERRELRQVIEERDIGGGHDGRQAGRDDHASDDDAERGQGDDDAGERGGALRR